MRKKIRNVILYSILMILPILVMGVNFKVAEKSLRYFSSVSVNGYQREYFAFFRALFLIVAAPLLLLFSVEKKKNRKYILLFFSFLGVQVVSYLLSPYRGISLWGINQRYEGTLTWGAYTVLCMSFFFGDRSKGEIKKVIYVLVAGSIPVWLIGFFQFFGKNFLMVPQIKGIINFFIEEPFREMSSSFGSFRSYGTLGNPNYMGSYAVMFIFIALYFIYRSRSKLSFALSSVFYAIILFNLLGSRSRAGFLSLIVTTSLFFLIYRENMIKKVKETFIVVVITILIWVGINWVSKGFVGEELDIVSGGAVNVVDIQTEEDFLKIINIKDDLLIRKNETSIAFYDENKRELETLIENGEVKIKDDRYSGFSFLRHGRNKDLYLLKNTDGLKYEFLLMEDGIKTVDHTGEAVAIPNLRRIEAFDGYEKKGSHRVYIWTRAIPFIWDRPLLGWGADTFSLVFPQNDFFGRIRAYRNKGVLVDKPHNLYIQIMMSFGVAGFGIFSLIIGGYLLKSLQIYCNKRLKSDLEHLGLFLFLGCVGYLIAGMFNDSMVAVAPFFWILLSTGIIINIKVTKH